MLKVDELMRITNFKSALRRLGERLALAPKAAAANESMQVTTKFVRYEDPNTGEVLYKTV